MPICPVSDIPAYCREIEKGFTEEKARKEADRCLQCGVICYSGAKAGGQKAAS